MVSRDDATDPVANTGLVQTRRVGGTRPLHGIVGQFAILSGKHLSRYTHNPLRASSSDYIRRGLHTLIPFYASSISTSGSFPIRTVSSSLPCDHMPGVLSVVACGRRPDSIAACTRPSRPGMARISRTSSIPSVRISPEGTIPAFRMNA